MSAEKDAKGKPIVSPEYHFVPQDDDRMYYFDMDGTLADLYGVPNVFQRLDNNDATPYRDAKPIPNMVALLHQLQDDGHRIGVITALSRYPAGTPPDVMARMDAETIAFKKQWLIDHNIHVDEFIAIPSSADKFEAATDKTAVLVDDDTRVLATWYSDFIQAIPENKMIK